MADTRRDGLLALGALIVVVAEGRDPFLRPCVAALGVGAALVVEWCFLAVPSLADGWERRGVPVAAAAVTVGAGLLVARAVPWVLGAAAWGLVTYLALLGCVLVGLGNPLTRLPGVED
jgi:hypothetical protein